MKHRILALLLLCGIALFGISNASAADAPTLTVLMYMCGTDLQSDCVNDMYEMCEANIPENVTVVVQAGGASEWDDDRLTPNASTASRLRTTISPTSRSVHGRTWATRRRRRTIWTGRSLSIPPTATC